MRTFYILSILSATNPVYGNVIRSLWNLFGLEYGCGSTQKFLFDKHLRTGRRFSIPLHNKGNTQYFINISIGDPPREYAVLVDTASSVLRMQNITCDDPAAICKDAVTIGGLMIESHEFAGADSIPDHIDFDGILGLGYHKADTHPQPLMTTIIKSKVLSEPILSMYLGDTSSTKQSEILLGGIDPDRNSSSFVHLPIKTKASPQWEVDLDALSFGSDSIELDPLGAVLDSGTPNIVLPTTVVAAINELIGRRELDCSARDTLPDLTFRLAGHDFTLSAHDYVVKRHGEETCSSGIIGIDFPPEIGRTAILGSIFLKKWYTVFDYGKQEVRLARAG